MSWGQPKVRKEEAWEEIQKKTFCNWINMHLAKRNLRVQDLSSDLSDGVKLIALLEILHGSRIEGRYYKNPKSKPYKIDNVNFALSFITDTLKIKLISCSAEDIVDGNVKIILGMCWRLIQSFQLAEDNSRASLLAWCKNATASYANLSIENFQSSFENGLVFCALLHSLDSSLLDFASLKEEHKMQNVSLAFNIAEEHFDIPPLLDASDVSTGLVDERSIMTYVSLIYRRAQERKAQALKATANDENRAVPVSSESGSLLERVRALEDENHKLLTELIVVKDAINSLQSEKQNWNSREQELEQKLTRITESLQDYTSKQDETLKTLAQVQEQTVTAEQEKAIALAKLVEAKAAAESKPKSSKRALNESSSVDVDESSKSTKDEPSSESTPAKDPEPVKEDSPKEPEPVKDEPAKEAPEPAKDEPAKEPEPAKDEPAKDESSAKDPEPVKDEPVKDEPAKDESSAKDPEPVKEDSPKEPEPAKDESVKEPEVVNEPEVAKEIQPEAGKEPEVKPAEDSKPSEESKSEADGAKGEADDSAKKSGSTDEVAPSPTTEKKKKKKRALSSLANVPDAEIPALTLEKQNEVKLLLAEAQETREKLRQQVKVSETLQKSLEDYREENGLIQKRTKRAHDKPFKKQLKKYEKRLQRRDREIETLKKNHASLMQQKISELEKLTAQLQKAQSALGVAVGRDTSEIETDISFLKAERDELRLIVQLFEDEEQMMLNKSTTTTPADEGSEAE